MRKYERLQQILMKYQDYFNGKYQALVGWSEDVLCFVDQEAGEEPDTKAQNLEMAALVCLIDPLCKLLEAQPFTEYMFVYVSAIEKKHGLPVPVYEATPLSELF